MTAGSFAYFLNLYTSLKAEHPTNRSTSKIAYLIRRHKSLWMKRTIYIFDVSPLLLHHDRVLLRTR